MYNRFSIIIPTLMITLCNFASCCEKTFAIIKPDAVAQGHAEKIISLIKEDGFTIAEQHHTILSRAQAEALYADYKEQHWFGMTVDFMTSGSVVLLVLEKDNAIAAWRALLGKSRPDRWGPLRLQFATSHLRNALHGADSPENAKKEIALFFDKGN